MATPSASNAAEDPLRAYQYAVNIEGLGEARFMKVTPVSFRVHPIRVRDGGDKSIVRHLPGPIEYGEVTFESGIFKMGNGSLLKEFTFAAISGNFQKRNVTVSLLSATSEPQQTLHLMQAWVTAACSPALDSHARDIAIVSMTVVFDELKWE
jgi:phage tail-like protein